MKLHMFFFPRGYANRHADPRPTANFQGHGGQHPPNIPKATNYWSWQGRGLGSLKGWYIQAHTKSPQYWKQRNSPQ